MRLHQWNSQFKNEIAALTNKPWMQYVWLILIILLAAALRLYKLGEWRFWFDETLTINRASSHYSDLYGLIRNLPPAATWMLPSVILMGFAMNYGCGQGAFHAKYFSLEDPHMIGRMARSVSGYLLRVPYRLFRRPPAQAYRDILYVGGLLYGAVRWLIMEGGRA